jgi:ADP-ribose pyrophosphatase
MSDALRPWKVLSHVIAYNGRFQVVEDLAETPNGEIRYSYIHSPAEVVATLPFSAENTVTLICEYRHPLGRVILDLPGGSIKPGETPEAAARRELEEEAGYRAGQMEPLGHFVAYPNALDIGVHLFLGRALQPVPRHPNRFEFGEPVEMDWETLTAQVLSGDHADAALQLAVLLALARGPRPR